MRACVNRNRGRYWFLFCKGPILNDIRGHSDPKKYMPDCRKSHLIFQNFLGEAPRPTAGARAFDARFGASPPYRPPLSKIPTSAPGNVLRDDVDLSETVSEVLNDNCRYERWIVACDRTLNAATNWYTITECFFSNIISYPPSRCVLSYAPHDLRRQPLPSPRTYGSPTMPFEDGHGESFDSSGHRPNTDFERYSIKHY